jgi:hypothetical protein
MKRLNDWNTLTPSQRVLVYLAYAKCYLTQNPEGTIAYVLISLSLPKNLTLCRVDV